MIEFGNCIVNHFVGRREATNLVTERLLLRHRTFFLQCLDNARQLVAATLQCRNHVFGWRLE